MKALSRLLRDRAHPPSSPRVQILSDLHLEVGHQYLTYVFPTSAPFLLLGGDIGRLIDYDGYLKFLESQVSRYERVFLVLGNHEVYGADFESGLETARRLSEEPTVADKLVLLNKARWDDPHSTLTILGCTLWSAIPEDAREIVKSKVSDFKKINDWTTQKHNEVHAQEASWLREQVAQVAGRRLLVATHHAPCVQGTSGLEHSDNPWTSAFATDLLGQTGWNGIRTWVFGHTHYSTDFRQNDGTRVIANQRGYVLPGSVVSDKAKKKDTHSFDDSMSIMV